MIAGLPSLAPVPVDVAYTRRESLDLRVVEYLLCACAVLFLYVYCIAFAERVRKVMPSLKYHFPPPPARRGLRTRPMTDDQKAMNAIFLR